MSYILDALNKADKERKQSAAPASETIITATPATQSNVVWFVALIMIGFMLVLWFVFQPQEARKPVATAVSIAPTPTPIKPKPIPGKPAATVQTTTILTPSEIHGSDEENRALPNIMALEQALLHQLPAINISAHIFSHAPSKRMVIINHQVHHEGDYIAKGLKLTHINQHGIELNFEGEAFSMNIKDEWVPR